MLENQVSPHMSPPPRTLSTRAFSILVIILIFLAGMILLGIYMPTVFFAILNTFWVVLIAVTVVFLFLGTLVIIGMKKEVSQILDVLLEGSLTVIDFVDFLRDLVRNFIALIREFILFATPVFAVFTALFFYVLLLFIYKTVGSEYDVTLFTVILTFSLIFVVGYLNRPEISPLILEDTWTNRVKNRFKQIFNDSLEVVVFVFFLTMDSTKIFFLPQHLNVELKAVLGNYDLMLRGFVVDEHLRTTVALIVAAIAIEIFRNLLRLLVNAVGYFKEGQTLNIQQGTNYRGVHILKESIRKSFGGLKDETLRFITFTTFLIFVFLLFPRLKLLAMAVSSVTFLILDFIFKERLIVRNKGTDLISRILGRFFKI